MLATITKEQPNADKDIIFPNNTKPVQNFAKYALRKAIFGGTAGTIAYNMHSNFSPKSNPKTTGIITGLTYIVATTAYDYARYRAHLNMYRQLPVTIPREEKGSTAIINCSHTGITDEDNKEFTYGHASPTNEEEKASYISFDNSYNNTMSPHITDNFRQKANNITKKAVHNQRQQITNLCEWKYQSSLVEGILQDTWTMVKAVADVARNAFSRE